jgi:ATP-dependent DNA helicase RecG
MVHPSFQPAGGPLPQALTPVYPTVAQLPQAYLRKAVLGALSRADLSETVPPQAWPEGPLQHGSLRQTLEYLHQPRPDVDMAALEDRSHPAWQRLKAEELLAQQLSQLQARQARDAMRAPVLPGCTRAKVMLWAEGEGRAVERANLTIDDVLAADEIFLTNSSWGVLPVVRIERHEVGGGEPGAVARAMRARWLA